MPRSISEEIDERRARKKQEEKMRQLGFYAMMGLLGLVFLGVIWWQFKHDPERMSINVNTASAKELAYLPEIGPELAKEILKGRPYATAEDLLKVKGIGPKTLEKMRPRLKFSD